MISKIDEMLEKPFLWILTLAAVILVSHVNIFTNGFVMDDFDYVVNWPLIQDWHNWPKFFVGFTPHPAQVGIYSPLKTLFHSINYHIFGLKPFGHHIISLIIHWAGTALVFKIAELLTKEKRLAFLTAFLFCLHPAHVESITYITASIDMAGIVFLFAAFYYFIRSVQEKTRARTYYIYSFLWAVLAIFTHELAISIPLLFCWYGVCFDKEPGKWQRTFLRALPYLLVVLVYAGCKHLVLGSVIRNAYLYDSFYLTMLVSLKAMAKYVYLCLFPIVLTHNHVISEGISSFDHMDFDRFAVLNQSIFDVQAIIALLVLGSLFYFAGVNFRKKPVIAFCIGWFYLCLLPVSNIIPSGVYFAERYLYPGMLAFCLLVAKFIQYLLSREGKWGRIAFKSIGILTLIIVGGFYGIRSYVRNSEWKNDVTFFESAVRANPKSSLMRNDLGIMYTEYGFAEKGVESIKHALAIQPNNPEFYFALGLALKGAKRYAEAIDAYEMAIELDNDFGEAYYNLATLFKYLGDHQMASNALSRALLIYRRSGRMEEARQLEEAFNVYFR